MTYNFIVVIIVGYFLGAIPFSYLISRKAAGVDLRDSGSKNLGAMNSYESTGKKWIGVVVFLLDFLKGLAAVMFARHFAYEQFLPAAAASLAVIIGHNYSIFMKFKGGRGLSTAVGALLPINVFALIMWGVMWLTGYFVIKKDIHVANISASILTPILVIFAPYNAIKNFEMMDIWWVLEYKVLIIMICSLLLLRHINVIYDWYKAVGDK